MACHNLLRDGLVLPAGTNGLLGLGLNYCIKSPHTRNTTKNTFSRLAEDVRRLYALRDAEDGDWIPSLYILCSDLLRLHTNFAIYSPCP